MTKHNCDSLHYTISIVDDSGTKVYNQQIDSHGVFNIYNLEPFTEHAVTIVAINNINLTSESFEKIVTVETCKYNKLLQFYTYKYKK